MNEEIYSKLLDEANEDDYIKGKLDCGDIPICPNYVMSEGSYRTCGLLELEIDSNLFDTLCYRARLLRHIIHDSLNGSVKND